MSRLIDLEKGRVAITNVKISYPNLFKLNQQLGGIYAADFLLHKDNNKDAIEIVSEIVKKLMVDNKIKIDVDFNNVCFKDIDKLPDNNSLKQRDYTKNHFLVRSKNKQININGEITSPRKPAVFDKYGEMLRTNEVIDSKGNATEAIYAGCYVDAVIKFYKWQNKTGGKGISSTIDAVRFANDGERLGGFDASGFFTFDEKPEVNLETAINSEDSSAIPF